MAASATDLRDPGAFERAHRALAARARASAQRVVRDPAAADDVVQDVFAALWSQPDLYDPARGSLETYVTLRARSRALDRVRRRAARDAALARAAAAERVERRPPETPEDAAIRREETRRLADALAALPPAQRRAVVATHGAGLTTREFSELAGVPLGTAKSRVRLGLRTLRSTAAEPEAGSA
jgi:RNA polymerase sigma-70 factor (ECF subfamily)